VIATTPAGPFTFNLGVWTPENWVRRYDPKGLFNNGVNVMFVAVLPSRIGGLRGYHSFTLYLTSRRVNGQEEYPDIRPPSGTDTLLPTEPGGLHLRYSVQQYLWQDPANPKRGWGLFGHVGVSSGAPGILDWSMTAGIAGSVPIRSHPDDRFGIGYFRYSLANRVVRGLAPVLPLDDEQGGEIYYTAQLFKGIRLTANGQLINPAIASAPMAAYAGLRLRTEF
jgi:porin